MPSRSQRKVIKKGRAYSLEYRKEEKSKAAEDRERELFRKREKKLVVGIGDLKGETTSLARHRDKKTA